jgi:general secretion pathway protein A
MYQDFFGLAAPPFELTSNPGRLYLTPGHAEALSNLEYGLSTAKAVTLLVGEAGTGKTTLLQAALRSERCQQVRAVSVSNPTLLRGEFVELLARSFGLSASARQSKTVLLEELENRLLERHERGEITALIVDEAQSLTSEILEEVRLLANFETAKEKLLPLVLAGQPELAERLEDAGLRQLKQRIALRCEITRLSMPETAAYIATRIKAVGGLAARLFTREAVVLIHQYSRGIPRTINVVCDNALLSAFALGRQPVDQAVVREVVNDFRLTARAGDSVQSGAGMGFAAAPADSADGAGASVPANGNVEESPSGTPGYAEFRSRKAGHR